jgi:type I restriction enzyme M protein
MARLGKSKKVVPFERELWNAAVQLRGNVAPADYKHYVLPLLFLRYLSLGYEKRREELRQEIHETQKKYGGKQLEILKHGIATASMLNPR